MSLRERCFVADTAHYGLGWEAQNTIWFETACGSGSAVTRMNVSYDRDKRGSDIVTAFESKSRPVSDLDRVGEPVVSPSRS